MGEVHRQLVAQASAAKPAADQRYSAAMPCAATGSPTRSPNW